MKDNFKKRILLLLEALSKKEKRDINVHLFCVEHNINYKSLYNSFAIDHIGIKMVHSLKNAVPKLNINWLLYEEGNMFMTHKLPSKVSNN